MTFSQSPFSALVIGASGGIGAAVARLLTDDPNCTHLETLSRRENGLDLADEQSVKEAAEALRDSGPFDLIFNASGILEVDGAPPEKAFRELNADTMTRAFAVNAVGGTMALKYFTPLLKRKGRSAFATLSARVGSIGDNHLGGWMSYRASKAALNQIVRCAAIEETRRNKDAVIISLHPGTIETPLTKKYARGRYTASPDEAAHNLLSVIARINPSQTGGFFDYAGEEILW